MLFFKSKINIDLLDHYNYPGIHVCWLNICRHQFSSLKIRDSVIASIERRLKRMRKNENEREEDENENEREKEWERWIEEYVFINE